MNFYVISDLGADTVPWVHIDTSNNKIYVIGFNKIESVIEQAVYNNYNLGIIQDFFSDYDAERFLNIDNLKSKVFANTFNFNFSEKFFKGSQLGCGAGNSLFSLSQSLVYTHNPLESISADNTKELQLWKISTSHPGRISLPEKFIFNKANTIIEETNDFTKSVALQIVSTLNANNLSNSLIILHGNPTYGYKSNLTPIPTINVHTTLVSYLPSITLTSDISNVVNDGLHFANITANISIANANTTLYFQAFKGYLPDQSIYVQNTSANVKASPENLANAEVMTIEVGWSNYTNVAQINISSIDSGATRPTKIKKFETPGTYSWPVEYHTSLTVKVWGGGGGGASGDSDGSTGTNSSFNNNVFANAGTGGIRGETAAENSSVPGANGTATGGDLNITGGFGGTYYGMGGLGSNTGSSLGYVGGRGGFGGYAEKAISIGILTGNVTIVVGAKGTGPGANGFNGAVILEWQT